MAKAKIDEKQQVRNENIEQTVSATEKFFEENKKTIWGVVIAVVLIGLGILAYQKFIYQPKCAEAKQQAVAAERNFQNSEYALALNGDGNDLGFADLIAEYGTKSGKAVYMYAGVCELQLGNFDNAISYLKKYNGKEPILKARAKACLGDAYVGLGDYKTAVKYFKEAEDVNDNVFVAGYLLKEGLAWEALGNKAEAYRCYMSIQENYGSSIEAYDISKYIVRVAE